MIWLKIQHVLDMTPGLTNKNKHCFLTQSGTKLKPIELGYTFHTSYKHSLQNLIGPLCEIIISML